VDFAETRRATSAIEMEFGAEVKVCDRKRSTIPTVTTRAVTFPSSDKRGATLGSARTSGAGDSRALASRNCAHIENVPANQILQSMNQRSPRCRRTGKARVPQDSHVGLIACRLLCAVASSGANTSGDLALGLSEFNTGISHRRRAFCRAEEAAPHDRSPSHVKQGLPSSEQFHAAEGALAAFFWCMLLPGRSRSRKDDVPRVDDLTTPATPDTSQAPRTGFLAAILDLCGAVGRELWAVIFLCLQFGVLTF